ncbi:MAG: serine/threonine-protein kinase [Myxococcota bacterium]
MPVVLRGFQTVRLLGRGGMGEVWLVVRREGAFVRSYALKRLRKDLRSNRPAQVAFVDEARVAGLLYHPNVVRVFDVGSDDDGPYMLMEHIDGMSLTQILRKCSEEEWDVPAAVAFELMRDVALGLQAAHEGTDMGGQRLEMIHRDLSPENVLVGFDGVARLADFGIAKALGRATETTRAILKGKVGYMAPEVLRYEQPNQRSDLFSFGVVLFELLAGRRLYGGDDAVPRILEEPQPDLLEERPDVPSEAVALLFGLLAKRPEDRPQSARVVVHQLERAMATLAADGELILAREFMASLANPTHDTVVQGVDSASMVPNTGSFSGPPPDREVATPIATAPRRITAIETPAAKRRRRGPGSSGSRS